MKTSLACLNVTIGGGTRQDQEQSKISVIFVLENSEKINLIIGLPWRSYKENENKSFLCGRDSLFLNVSFSLS